MNNQTLVVYDFEVLYEILSELENDINFKIINLKKFANLDLENQDNNLIISCKRIRNVQNQLDLINFPINISKLIENINIKFLKQKYSQQSEIELRTYKLNLNSRKIYNSKKSLNLTEREANIIIFLNDSKKPVKISQLQTEVWGHNLKLETHTVETHIYRLRKKIKNIFHDNNFIKSSKSGYII